LESVEATNHESPLIVWMKLQQIPAGLRDGEQFPDGRAILRIEQTSLKVSRQPVGGVISHRP
jgi:hypothetical protein